MKRGVIAAISLLVLLPACSAAPEATPRLEDAISQSSPTQEIAASTPQPTATISLPTATSQEAETARQTPQEAATGEIYGRITNGTPGGEIPDGLLVTLYGLDGQAVVLELTGEAEADGDFSFEGVAMAAERAYIVAAAHQGVLYFTEGESMPPDTAQLELPLTIYDITQDAAHISVEQLHILFDFSQPGVMSVLEVWVLSNDGDRTFAPEVGGMEFVLPDGAGALRFQGTGTGDRFQLTDEGFYDLAPVRPGVGSSELLFTFDLPYDRRLDFSQPMSFEIQAVDVLIQEGGPQIREGDLVDNGIRQVSSGTLRTFSAGPIAAGESLEFRIAGRIAGVEGETDFTPLMGVVIGAAVLGIVLVGLGLWWFRAGGRPSPKQSDDKEENVLRAIAGLDDEHAAGTIADDEYRKRRAELKQRALDSMQEDHDRSS